MMGKLIRFLLLLVVLALIGLVAYAYLGDLSPRQETVSKPVVLDAR